MLISNVEHKTGNKRVRIRLVYSGKEREREREPKRIQSHRQRRRQRRRSGNADATAGGTPKVEKKAANNVKNYYHSDVLNDNIIAIKSYQWIIDYFKTQLTYNLLDIWQLLSTRPTHIHSLTHTHAYCQDYGVLFEFCTLKLSVAVILQYLVTLVSNTNYYCTRRIWINITHTYIHNLKS